MPSQEVQELYVGKLPLRFKPEAPPPVPLHKLIIGPVILTLGMSIGSGELLIWPIMSTSIGPVLLWAGLISLIFQTIWTLEMARWTVWTGEHWVLQMARLHGILSALIIWNIFVFIHQGFGGWAASSGATVAALVKWPAGAVGAAFWAAVLMIIIWVIALISGVVREWVEKILTIKMLLVWIILVAAVGAITAKVPHMWGDIARGIFVPSWPSEAIPSKYSYYALGGAIAYIGAGGMGNMWYSFWVRDAGYGMGAYIGKIPGFLRGKPLAIELTGYLPTPTRENLERIKTWWRRIQAVFWTVFFVLNYITIVLFVALVYGAYQLGFTAKSFKDVDVIMLEAETAMKMLGNSTVVYVLFIIVAVLLLWGTQLSIVEGTSRQIADTIFVFSERARRLFRNDVRTTYFVVISLFVLWGIFWASLLTMGIRPILLIYLAANTGLVFQVISAPLTVWFLYRVAKPSVPKEIWDAMKPHPVVPVLMILASIYWLVFSALAWGELLGLLP